MSKQPLFKPNDDGGYDISPAGVLLILTDTANGDPSEVSPIGMTRCLALIDAILTAAHAGGYKQCDILKTLLARNQPSRRITDMAQAACTAAGDAAMRDIFARAKLA